MARSKFVQAFSVIVALSAVVSTPTARAGLCPTGFANFGDSITDTGNVLNAFPFLGDADSSPYGETFFEAPAKRFSNGRLIPDFISLAFRKPLLDPYFATTAFNYQNGINFAAAGATAGVRSNAIVPFSLGVQVAQYIRFMKSVKATTALKSCSNFVGVLPISSPYSDWLYTVEIGDNDLFDALLARMAFEDIITTTIPESISNITSAVQTLYTYSARNFLIIGLPPNGCTPVVITAYGNGLPKDSMGCIIAVNELYQAHNTALVAVIESLRNTLHDISISYFDFYSARIELYQNPTKYGLDPSKTVTACCGAPGVGTLNYNPNITCGHPDLGSNNCANPEQYTSWDGIHVTEKVYRIMSEFLLNGYFTDNPANYSANCNLDFSNFGPEVTYKQVYDSQCDNLFN